MGAGVLVVQGSRRTGVWREDRMGRRVDGGAEEGVIIVGEE